MEQRKWYVTQYVDIDTGEVITKKHYKSFKSTYKIINKDENYSTRTINNIEWTIKTTTNHIRWNGQISMEI